MKKILIGLGLTLLLVLGALAAIPYLFKDRILAEVKKAANENLTATLDFKDLNLSVFRHFPKLSVGLEGLDITGQGTFEGVKLVQCERLDVAVDLWSAIFGNEVVIKGLYFQKPDIRVYVLSDGTANYDITKPGDTPETAATETASSPVKLERYAISEGKVLYDDRSLDMKAELEGLNHEGSGEFTADLYDLVMKTAVEKLSVNYGGMQYLRAARADWDAILGADMKNMKFTFKNNDLKVNALEVMLDGWVQLPNDEDIAMDLKFGTPQNTFKSFLSIIPGAYTKDFDGVQADGTVQFGGLVKGTYNEKTYPAFKIDLKVGNGSFKYPSLPLGVGGIDVDASVNSPSQRLNDMTVDIPKFSLRIGSNPLAGYFHLKTPESDPTVDTKINGTLNFNELSKAFPIAGVDELSGILKADVMAKAAMSQIDAQRYDEVNMAGDFSLQGMTYRAAGTPTVKINDLNASLSPQKLDLRNFDARLGKSDLRASGTIDNVLAYFSTNKTMTGRLTLQSAYFDANEWLEEPPASETSKVPSDPVATTSSAAADEKVFDRWDFTVDGKIGKLKYDVYDISDLAVAGHFTPNKMSVSDFGLKIGDSDLRGNGQILNAWNYLFDNQTVAGKVDLRSTYFNLNQFMTEAPATAPAKGSTPAPPPAPTGVIPVPKNIDMTLNATLDKVLYTNLTLNNLNGAIVVKDGTAKLADCTAGIFGGQVAINGEYNTKDEAKPLFNIDMALLKMSFGNAFQSFETVKKFFPIAQLVDGTFNTTLSMSGLLGKDMMPDFNTVSMAGFLETLDAILNNVKPLNAIGDKLNVSYLKRLEIKNTKNWFEIKDGKVVVKPFNLQMRDVAMQIGGSHGLNQEMDYQIVTKMPRKALEKNAVGATANAGLSWLSGEAAKVGVNIAQGEFINVRFDLAGSLFNPKVTVKVLGSDGERTIQDEAAATAKAVVGKAKDSLTTVANKELDKAKDKAKAAADKAVDSLGKIADKKVQEAKDKAVETVKDEAGKVIGKEVGEKLGDKAGEQIGEKAGEVLGDKGKKTVEDVKGKLDKWDPFKKKPKKEGGN